MKRTLTTLTLLLALAPHAWAANEAALTGKTLIDSDVVTVGDLFTNSGSHAGYVLAPAPKAGDHLVLDKGDLMRVSDAFQLHWKPETDNVTVSLERNATLISEDQIVAALAASELKDKISSDAKFKINNLLEAVTVPGKNPVELVIKNTEFNQSDDSFRATMEIKNGDNLLRSITLEGVATAMVQVPGVKYTMVSGSEVTDNDVIDISVPKNQLRNDSIVSRSDLIGMTIKRTLQPNQLLSEADVIPPMMIKRNDLVTVIYKNGAIQLSTKARSLSNGSRGDVVQLVNPSSKKSFDAKVTGPMQAEVNVES